jgi:hypothetical protein
VDEGVNVFVTLGNLALDNLFLDDRVVGASWASLAVRLFLDEWLVNGALGLL